MKSNAIKVNFKFLQMAILLVFSCSFIFASTVYAQEFVDKTFEGVSSEKSASAAKRDIIEQAQKHVTEELTRELLGEEKFQKNKAQILNKVFKMSEQFVPYSKPGTLEQKDGQFKMSVLMRVNTQLLNKVLQEQGMTVQSSIDSVVLPMITFENQISGLSYSWWTESPMQAESSDSRAQELAFLKNLAVQFENQLQSILRKNQFYLVKPIGRNLQPVIPSALRGNYLNQEAEKQISVWFMAPYILEGTIKVQPNQQDSSRFKLDVKLSMKYVESNKVVADIVRSYETDRGPHEVVVSKKWREILSTMSSDLVTQVSEASSRGAIGADQIKLTISPKPTFLEIEKFKEQIKSAGVGVKSVYERLISSDQVTLEIYSQVPTQEIAAKLKKITVPMVQLDSFVSNNETIELKWIRQRGSP